MQLLPCRSWPFMVPRLSALHGWPSSSDFQEKSKERRAKYPNPYFPAVIAAIIPSELALRSGEEQKPDEWGENINSNLLVSTWDKQTEWKLKEERRAQLLSCNKYAAAQNN